MVIGERDAFLHRGQLRAWICNQLFAKAKPPPFLEAVAERLRRQNFDKTHGSAQGAPPSSRSAAPALPLFEQLRAAPTATLVAWPNRALINPPIAELESGKGEELGGACCTQLFCVRAWSTAAGRMGKCRSRAPTAAKIALLIAGATTVVAASNSGTSPMRNGV